ncbi:eukaryotic translation initiation factor 3 subunit F [Elysia marginata]|uniref:Eukaryotic translation initiation factor 3 subunit F n=1 Tax=Elysia marginata TaxID=1093978 RepID=A0AAV4EDA8_9GAST|nr:eukaryotic translation initiation factor 3 subunit F [Elysia marginata]
MEMRCYRRLLSISHKEHITNEEVRRRIENAIGPHVDLLTIVRQRKLKWCGHTTRSSGIAKTIMQGTVNGGRRKAWKTTSKNGQDLCRETPYGQLKIEMNGKLWGGGRERGGLSLRSLRVATRLVVIVKVAAAIAVVVIVVVVVVKQTNCNSGCGN